MLCSLINWYEIALFGQRDVVGKSIWL